MADNKLYPPTIASSIPAFYEENGTVKITVPFSMNRAVSQSQVGGFSLKIKTAQSNFYLGSSSQGLCDYVKKVVIFYLDSNSDLNPNIFKLGQFYKFQLAYINSNDQTTIGYYSTVAVGKFTSKPTVEIKEYANATSSYIPFFNKTCTGIYTVGEDITERPYQYRFIMYDINMNIVEDTDWLLHNSSLNTIKDETLNPEEAIDIYTFKASPRVNETYYITYGVKTINNLEVYSSLYPCMDIDIQGTNVNLSLIAENIFDEGYIKLSFRKRDNNNNDQNLNVSMVIERAEKTDNFQSWKTLKKVFFNNYDTAVNKWEFKDFTIEQGMTYRYSFREYNQNNVYASRVLAASDVYADFEDMFLLGENNIQLKIRFNPKVTSFKETKLEQKIDTIGNKYPFIFKNGTVGYKEFPISGLISYQMDDNELFINHLNDLNILSNAKRYSSPVNQNEIDTNIGKSWELSQTINALGYNIAAERKFKLKVLNWLNDGKIKLFRSPTEGNYLIRLLNVSLSPEDKLGRMIHNFSATAYEMKEITYENLIDLGFISLEEAETIEILEKTLDFSDWENNNIDSIKLNKDQMFNFALISFAKNSNSPNYIILRSNNDSNRKIYLVSSYRFDATNKDIDDLYLNQEDNDIDINTLVKQITLTYQYQQLIIHTGDIGNIENVYVKTEIKSIDEYEGDTYQLLSDGDIKLLFLQISKKDNNNSDDAYTYYFNNNSNNSMILKRDINISQLEGIESITFGEGIYITYGVLQKVIEQGGS